MKNSFQLFKIQGIPIEINYSWFIILFLITWTLASGYFPLTAPGFSPFTYLGMGLITAILLFASLVLHELGHSLVAKSQGIPIKGITLFVFGGVAQITKEPDSPETELKMAAAGPATSFGLAFVFWLLSVILSNLGILPLLSTIFGYLILINIAVAIFNLLPGFPLDGGRILRSLLWKYLFPFRKATRIASSSGKFFSYLLMLLGMFYFFLGYFLSGIWLIFIGLFLLQAAQASYQQVLSKQVLGGVKIRDIMTPHVVSVSPLLSVEDLVHEFFFKYHHTMFPVVDNNNLMGFVTLDLVRQIPKEKWKSVYASEIMVPVNEQLILHQSEDAVEALTHLIKTANEGLPVVERGNLVGILTRRDILQLFRIKIDLGD